MYSLVKHLEEQLAIKLCRWDPQLSISALRFSNVMAPEDYAAFPAFQDDPTKRIWNLWGYIDTRDGAQAVIRALEANRPGFEAYVIAAADTVEPAAEHRPGAGVLPRRAGDPRARRIRDPALDPEGRGSARVPTSAQLA